MRNLLAHHRARLTTVLAASAGVVAFGTYLFNSLRHDVDSFRGDQWFWMTNLLLPLENDRLSMFDTITFEYEPLAHSHIPTFATMVLNRRLLDLDTTVDMVIGVLSLIAVFAIAWLHVGEDRRSVLGKLTLAAIAGIVFMSLDGSNFIWSLLQFQLFYIAVGVAYMWRFGRYVERPTYWWPFVAVPVAMIVGDAAGVAAVIASAIYLVPLLLARRVNWRHGATVGVSIAGAVVIVGNLLRGQKGHGGEGPLAFAETLLTDPAEPLHSFYFALSQAFVGLHRGDAGFLLIRWDFAILWFAVGMFLVGFAAWGVRKGGIGPRDHFPIMLVIATLFWTLGVVRSRVWFFGPEATMQQPRYGANTTLLGVGVLLLLVNHRKSLVPRARAGVGGLIALVVVANLAGSISVSRDSASERQQDNEVVQLRAYIVGDRDDAPNLGLSCSDWAPCFEAGSYLWGERLGPFSGDPDDRPTWYVGFRDAVYDRFYETADETKTTLCAALANASIDVLTADITSEDGLAPWLERGGVEVPDDDVEAAATFTGRAMDSSCLAFELSSGVSLEE